MIEREYGQFISRVPCQRWGVIVWLKIVRVHLCQKNHGKRTDSRIPSRFATGIQLLKFPGH